MSKKAEKSDRENTRPMEIYNGDPPAGMDGKVPKQWRINKKCGFMDTKTGKKCDIDLWVVRVMRTTFEHDTYGFGGQLNYDERQIRQYIYCPHHDGVPAEADKW